MGARTAYSSRDTATYLLYRVGRLFRHKAAAHLKARGVEITPEQWSLLLRIAERPDLSPGDLVDPAFGDYPNVSRMLDGLERAGLARRFRDPGDGRLRRVRATRAGEGLVDEILPGMIEEKAKYYEGLDERDVARLMELLRIIEGNLEECGS